MKIKQDPITKLWCREDGAVLMPPSGCKFRKFRWTFGSDNGDGYRKVHYGGKRHSVHRLICRAFNGLPPLDRPEVDHINRIVDDNRPANLRWASAKENKDNRDCVDKSLEKYGVRACEDMKAYASAYTADKRARGLTRRKGPDGKYGWFEKARP